MIKYILNNDYKGIISEYIVHSGLDLILKKFLKKEVTTNLNTEKQYKKQPIESLMVNIPETPIEEALANGIIQIFNWSKEVKFREMDENKSLFSVYIELEFHLSMRRYQVDTTEFPKRATLEYIFSKLDRHFIVVGDPGAGKTTLVKNLCQKLLRKESKYFNDLNYPILVRLRDLNDFDCTNINLILFDYIISIFGFTFANRLKEKKKYNGNEVIIIKRYISEFLEELNILLLLDGYDEINDSKKRKVVISDVEFLCKSFVKSKLLITSRSADFKFSISNTVLFEICELSEPQIISFTDKWLQNKEEANKLRNELKLLPYFDTAKRPLILAHLCAIYERYKSLPPKPKSIYKKIVTLYLEEWDIQRRIYRKKIGEEATEYSRLDNDRKQEFLAKLAYTLTTDYQKFIFSDSDLKECFGKLAKEFGLPIKQKRETINEIESHSGVLIQSSATQFEFSHKSIQEYLTADYLVRLGTFPNKKNLLLKIPNELAICLALNSNPNNYLANLVLYKLKNDIYRKSFLNPFLNRIVHEKPDFSCNPILGMTILSIYTLSKFGTTIITQEVNKKMVPDRNNESLNYLMKLIVSTPIIKESIKEYYEEYTNISENSSFMDKVYVERHYVFLLKRHKQLHGMKENIQPKYLAINQQILDLIIY